MTAWKRKSTKNRSWLMWTHGATAVRRITSPSSNATPRVAASIADSWPRLAYSDTISKKPAMQSDLAATCSFLRMAIPVLPNAMSERPNYCMSISRRVISRRIGRITTSSSALVRRSLLQGRMSASRWRTLYYLCSRKIAALVRSGRRGFSIALPSGIWSTNGCQTYENSTRLLLDAP